MTTNNTEIMAVSDGKTTARRQARTREHGLTVLRDIEARALISLASDALSQTHSLSHDIHRAVYDQKGSISGIRLQQILAETLTCMEVAEHYLLMLGSVFEDRSRPARPGFPGLS